MSENEARPLWMNDESVRNISEEKLNFLYELFQNGKGKSQKEIMAFFLPMMKKAKSQNLDFTPNEISTCIQAIKKHSTPEELSRIDKLLQRQQQ